MRVLPSQINPKARLDADGDRLSLVVIGSCVLRRISTATDIIILMMGVMVLCFVQRRSRSHESQTVRDFAVYGCSTYSGLNSRHG